MPAWFAPAAFVATLGALGWASKYIVGRVDKLGEIVSRVDKRLVEHHVRLEQLERMVDR